ncbi:hypothetical protein [Shouchella shacheensis]|nr:hypothetical protein [Shouchella shacheensis]
MFTEPSPVMKYVKVVAIVVSVITLILSITAAVSPMFLAGSLLFVY